MGFLSFEKRNIILLLLFAYIQFIQSSAITDITNGNKPIVEVIIILSFSNVPKLLAGILRIITIYQTKSKIHKKKITFGSKGVLIYSVMLIMEATNQILFISHSQRLERALKYKKAIIERFHPKDVIIEEVGQSCGANIGPGLCCVYFFGKKITPERELENKIFQEFKNKK